MEWKMNPNAVNQLLKGTDFYIEGEPVYSIAMIIKGRVMIHNSGAQLTAGSGSFLGMNDLYAGKYQSTYTAYDDLIIYVYPIEHIEDMDTILLVNKDYHGFMVASYNKMIKELHEIYRGLLKIADSMYQSLVLTKEAYMNISVRLGVKGKTPERVNQIKPLDRDFDFLESRINYYIACSKLPLEVVKEFYSYGNSITLYQLEDQVNVVNQQIEVLKELTEKFLSMAECLVDDSETCMFQTIARMVMEAGNAAGVSDEVIDLIDGMIQEVNQAEMFSERMLGKKYIANRKMMEEVYHLILISNMGNDIPAEAFLKYSKDDAEQALEEMSNSFHKIIEYAGIEEVRAKEMEKVMLEYVCLKDKLSTDDNIRPLRKLLTENHYEIYTAVFLRAYREKSAPRMIDMFLKYGFADDRLLTKDQMLSIYFLPAEDAKQGHCKVYDMKTWLTLIYEGKKEPSKNEFDQDYTDLIAGLKKQGKLSETEAAGALNDPLKRLTFEIQNMFRYNNRTTNGQITSFVPFLHKDQWVNSIERLYVTATKVNEALGGIMRIDYSVFDREVLYINKEKNIMKEYIIKRIFPDIILMPNVGSNGVMWQEIVGRKRDTKARFLLPIFTDINLGILLVRILGRYRWELCRTIEGIAWNDITRKSLTSEYSDYLQFYRKNKGLTEEKKGKIKMQIQKGRNSSREIFVIDYEQWINYEAMGAIKLNKLVREIMATYCPFSKQIRDQLKFQPVFEEAMERYDKEKRKKVREIEARFRLLQKDQIQITPELMETLNYYKES